jgi:hypothetical protein
MFLQSSLRDFSSLEFLTQDCVLIAKFSRPCGTHCHAGWFHTGLTKALNGSGFYGTAEKPNGAFLSCR